MGDEGALSLVTFEAALTRLEQIVREMEDSALPLQRLLLLFEEGTELGRHCQELLDGAELRIRQVTQDADGAVRVQNHNIGGLDLDGRVGATWDVADPAF